MAADPRAKIIRFPVKSKHGRPALHNGIGLMNMLPLQAVWSQGAAAGKHRRQGSAAGGKGMRPGDQSPERALERRVNIPKKSENSLNIAEKPLNLRSELKNGFESQT